MHIISEMDIFDSYLSIIKLFYIIKEIFMYIFNIHFEYYIQFQTNLILYFFKYYFIILNICLYITIVN